MSNRKYLFISIMLQGIVIIFQGCSGDSGVCISSTGSVIRQDRNLPAFNQVDIQDNLNLILTNDSVSGVVVEAGQNIISGIATSVVNGQLILRNYNKCNWLRDYNKPVNVYVPAGKLWRIVYNGSGDISSTGTLKMDSIKVEVWGGCGIIELSLDSWQGSFSLNMGCVDFRLHGVCAIAYVYTSDYGLYDARDLKTGYTFITTKGSNDNYVRVINSLEANIGSIGNVYYTGSPKSIVTHITGTGKVIPF